jgi:hypothetical protein
VSRVTRYLIITADGTDTVISVVNADGLERHLKEASDFANEGGRDPVFLTEFPENQWGQVTPGEWPEGTEMILKVEIMVPTPVTTKWSI